MSLDEDKFTFPAFESPRITPEEHRRWSLKLEALIEKLKKKQVLHGKQKTTATAGSAKPK